jgi:hypothetical protein
VLAAGEFVVVVLHILCNVEVMQLYRVQLPSKVKRPQTGLRKTYGLLQSGYKREHETNFKLYPPG